MTEKQTRKGIKLTLPPLNVAGVHLRASVSRIKTSQISRVCCEVLNIYTFVQAKMLAQESSDF